jgi:hypothetical protein
MFRGCPTVVYILENNLPTLRKGDIGPSEEKIGRGAREN